MILWHLFFFRSVHSAKDVQIRIQNPYQYRLVDQINCQRVPAKRCQSFNKWFSGQVRQLHSADVVWIEHTSEAYSEKDHSEPGEERNVVQGTKILWGEPQPEKIEVTDADVLKT